MRDKMFMKCPPKHDRMYGHKRAMSTTNWHLPGALPASERQRHLPYASMETEPHSAKAVDFQQPWRDFRVERGTLLQGLWSVDSWVFLGIDFMVSILAPPPI